MCALILTNHTIRLERLPDLFGHRVNLRPGWRDEQRGLALLRRGHIRIGCTLVKCSPTTTMMIGGNLRHGTKLDQLGKRLVGLFGGGEFNDFPERGGLLSADGRQLAESVG